MTEDERGEAPESMRSQRAFLAHVRHELRTPLNAILGYSEMLIEDARELDQEGIIEDLEKLHGSGQELLALVNRILDPTLLDARDELDLESFGTQIRHELRTPLNDVIGYSEMLIEDARDLGLEDFVPELEKIAAAGQKLLALLDDILRFSNVEAGQVELDGEAAGVSTMVRDVVTTIRPLDEQDAERTDDQPGRVLVVDDNETNRDLLFRRLTRQGYEVAVAEDGRRALERISAEEFDLVLLDIMMPELNGYQVLQHLKSDARLRHIPVIMISALDEVDSVVRCIGIGAEDYLSKPFNPVLLKARIGACLEKKRLRDREVLHLRQIEEEKKRSDELLHVILPDEIVAELKATNQVKPRLHEKVAVLFCDIVAFTSYCESRPPEEVVACLQELVEAYEEIAPRYQLEKIKTIGDAFMATAGLLKPVANPVLQCVKCGLEMISLARGLSAQWNVRVGIHVGPVMAGVVGHRQYMFDLWGDTVNTAARVESQGVNGSVNVSATAWECVADHCHGESLGLVMVKGKGEVEIIRVDGMQTVA
jgi:adenylate cyclase